MKSFTTLFTFIFLLFAAQYINAQNVKVKNIPIQYKQLALEQLPDNIQTYSVTIQSGYVTLDNREALIRQYLSRFVGYQRVEFNGDLQVHITFKGLDIINREVIYETDDETDQAKDYQLRLTHTFPVRLEAYDQAGNYYMDTEIIEFDQYRYTTFGNGGYATEEDLVAAYETEKATFWQDYERRIVAGSLRAAQDSLVTNYSEVMKRETIRVAYGKGKKLNYADLENAVSLADRAYQLAAKEQDVSSDLQDIILIWETALQEKNTTNKKARINAKIARWLHYNCAMAYAWLNDFDTARRHALEAEVIPTPAFSSQFDVVQLRRYITDRERRYLANL